MHQQNNRRRLGWPPLYHLGWLGLVVFLFWLWPRPGLADAGSYVVTNTNDSGPGSLREALSQAPAGQPYVITFDNSISLPSTITLQSALPVVSTTITIQGPTTGHLTVSGNGQIRPFLVYGPAVNGAGDLTIANLTVANGANGDGGGIDNEGGVLRLVKSQLLNNQSRSDGLGGALYSGSAGTVIIDASTIANNRVPGSVYGGTGAGLYLDSGVVTITNSTISDNSTATNGFAGGIYIGTASVTITASTITANQSLVGGGIQNANGTLSLADTVLSGNLGTIGGDLYGAATSQGYNYIGLVDGSTPFTPTNTDLSGTSPALGPLQENGGPTLTRVPSPSSVLVEAGNAFGLTTDQRGFHRPSDSDNNGVAQAEIGSVEVQGANEPNQPPIITAPANFQANEYITATLGGLSVTDPDAGSAPLSVTLGVQNGSLEISSTAGISLTTSLDGHSLVISGSQTALNPVLAGLSYRGNQYFSGADNLTIIANDLGNTGSGGPQVVSQTVPITVASALVVTKPQDDAAATQFGSLSYALQQAADPGRPLISGTKTVSFAPSVLTVTLTITNGTGLTGLSVASGVTVQGGSCANPVTISGNGRTSDGLILTGGATLRNLRITAFQGKLVRASATSHSGPNVLRCVQLKH